MKRMFAALAVVCGTLGCKVDLNGTCAKDSDCKAGLSCDSSVDPRVCVSACDPVCGSNQTCANAKCVSTGPTIGRPSAVTVASASRHIPASESARRNRFLFLDGELQKLPASLWAFLTSNMLSWRAKFALLTERFRRRLLDPAEAAFNGVAESGRVSVTTDVLQAVLGSDLSLICVGTPSASNGSQDQSAILKLVHELGRAMREKTARLKLLRMAKQAAEQEVVKAPAASRKP